MVVMEATAVQDTRLTGGPRETVFAADGIFLFGLDSFLGYTRVAND